MQFIDTHTHVNLRAFKDDAKETIQRALDSGVMVVNTGTQIDTSREAVAMLNVFSEGVYAVVGLHPTHAGGDTYVDTEEVTEKTDEAQGFDSNLYRELAQNERVVGIGECGLDYYRLPKDDNEADKVKNLQRAAFHEQIKLAIELDKVLCVHCRPLDGTNDAYEEMLEILSVVKKENPQLRFEIHCYTGSPELAQKFYELGGFIALNGIITFDKTTRSKEVVDILPLEAIILETDAPYLTPISHRGQRNEPSYVIEVAEKIAEWKGISLEEVAAQTTLNAKKLFNIL